MYELKVKDEDMYNTVEELFKINGFSTSTYDAYGIDFLEVYKDCTKLTYLAYIEKEKVLNKVDVCKIVNKLKNNYLKDIDIKNYLIISINGYEKEDMDKIYEFEKYGIKIEDSSYLDVLYKLSNNEPGVIDLYAHNKATYREIINKYNSGINRCCAVQATGTGKSFLIGKLCAYFKGHKKLILSPSTYINNQFINNFNWIKENTTFFTYSKFSILVREDYNEIERLKPQVIILDEYHRLGSKKWGAAVNKLLELYPNAFVFGTSATDIRYLDNARNMSDELFFGNRVSDIGLSKAITLGILPMPKYISAIFDISSDFKLDEISKTLNVSEGLKRTDYTKAKALIKELSSSLQNLNGKGEILKKYITKERNFIVFCDNVGHLEYLKQSLPQEFKKEFNINVNVYEMHSKNKNSKSNYKMFVNNMDNSEFNLLFTVDMLNEGVHIEGIDGAIMVRRTSSLNIVFQQLGRVLSANSNKTPLVFDLVSNMKLLHLDSFTTGLIREQVSKREYFNNRGIYYKEVEFNKIFGNIHDECKDIREIIIRISKIFEDSWDVNFTKLLKYKEKYGDCEVPLSYGDKSLAIWTWNQRALYNADGLKKERFEKLNSIDFIWDIYKFRWIKFWKRAKENKEKNKGFIIISKHDEPDLYNWYYRQRKKIKENKLLDYQVSLMKDLDINPCPITARWIVKFLKYESFVKENNRFQIRSTDGHVLYGWMAQIKKDYKNGTLDEWKIEKLLSVGYDVRKDIILTLDERWELRFRQYEEWRKETDYKLIISKFMPPELHSWLRNQMANNRQKNLSEYRYEKLKGIGVFKDGDKQREKD